jgi:hypothetical protein
MIEVKKTITNTMFTTGASLVILAAFSILFGKEFSYSFVVLQIFAANIVINFGLFMLWKIEIRYLILQYMVDVGYIILVLVVFGFIFDWYSTVPVWFLVAAAAVIYAFAAIITATKFRKDTEEINELLQKRKEKIDSSAT